MIPPIIRLTSDTLRLQHASRSPVARRQAHALSTKAVQIRRARGFESRFESARRAKRATIPNVAKMPHTGKTSEPQAGSRTGLPTFDSSCKGICRDGSRNCRHELGAVPPSLVPPASTRIRKVRVTPRTAWLYATATKAPFMTVHFYAHMANATCQV